ncbi:MAG: plastocyanin/azurin family copper-binding protein [Vicinamibacterales bacterium]
MKHRRTTLHISRFVFAATLLTLTPVHAQTGGQAPAPKILLDQSPRAIEYQLNRLSNSELIQLDRKDDDGKYRLVYYALLTRKGLGREYFDEALAALMKMDRASRTQVILEGLSKVRGDDTETADKLLRVLFAQSADTLKKERELFAQTIEKSASPRVLEGAYGAVMLSDATPDPGWQLAAKHEGHLVELLRSVPLLASAPPASGAQAVREKLFEPVAALLQTTTDPATKIAAIAALGSTRADGGTFQILSKELLESTEPEMRAAAIRSLLQIPQTAWPAGQVEPLARALVTMVGKAAPEQRTEPSMTEAIHLAERLTDALPDESKRAVKRDLRSLGVQVVRIQAVPEEMTYDLKWFVVEAGKPVQIVLFNPDAMSHNLVVGQPGTLKDIGMAATTMTLSTDPKAKPYVPDIPAVLQATRLLNWGETERLSFAAPKEPGEYVYVCTFPGHWVRMYGVMLVVENLEAWEANPRVPKDPMTDQPFAAQRK